MFGPTTVLIALIALAMLSAGSLAYVFLYRRIETENAAGRRLDQIQGRGGSAAASASPGGRVIIDPAKRRKSVQDTLKELDEKQKARTKHSKSPPMSLRLQQAGLNWSRRTFLIFSLVCGLVGFAMTYFLHAPLYASAAVGFAGTFGVPRWMINFLRKRRIKRFLEEFPNAMDVIVRGVKAGLPLNECVRIVAMEAAEPVKTEFRQMAETQALGVSLAEAVGKLPERVPVPEASFFAIVITIQQKAGGNLSETLGNLSRVLRERRKMVGKIKAMSMEAKASAAIIGSLPIIVMGLVYLTSPHYMSLLFTDPLGNLILGASAFWMFLGIMVMRRMINFDF
jgi:tight adherence protein B